ncbi:MAG: phosphohistidine phosphatase SixA [Prochlorotrichaceae cyanobacterium]
MQLYLIRHGIAIDRSETRADQDRTLTAKGQEKTKAIAQRLKALNLSFDRLLSSPFCRAKETAAILQQAGLVETVETWDGLKPGGSLEAWLDWCATALTSPCHCMALVGHEPDLSTWAAQLLWGASAVGRDQHFVLKKGGIIGLTLPDSPPFLGQGELFWLTPPRFLL